MWQTSSVINKEGSVIKTVLQTDGNCELKWCMCSLSADTKQEKYVAANNAEVNTFFIVTLKRENVNDNFFSWSPLNSHFLDKIFKCDMVENPYPVSVDK